jgi:hypothetical protein
MANEMWTFLNKFFKILKLKVIIESQNELINKICFIWIINYSKFFVTKFNF